MELSTTAVTLAARMQNSDGLMHCLVVMRGLDVGNVVKLDRPVVVAGRDESCDVVLSDEGISRRHARFIRQGDQFILEDLGSTNGVFVNGTQIDVSVLSEGDKILLGRFTVLKYTQQDELELEYQRRIHESASNDGLTGALNRRSLETRLESEWSFAHRHGTDLSVIMFDVDHFKRVNDTFGHAMGDEVLRAIADTVKKTIRMEDVFGRYGGEEFVLVVRGVGHEGALGLAQRLRILIELLRLQANGRPVPITISLGVATCTSAQVLSAEALIKLADKRLYVAKETGRNRVVGE
jgi:two-component system, cell cycle response regulator